MFDLTFEQPRHGLKSRVWMRAHRHAAGVGNGVGSKVVNKTPRANSGAPKLGECSTHGHGTKTPEGNRARGEDAHDCANARAVRKIPWGRVSFTRTLRERDRNARNGYREAARDTTLGEG